jgi:hypothetical protein
MMRRLFSYWTAVALALALNWNLAARDVFVLISGGDSPLENNYSQYLQARAIVTCWERSYSSESIWVFFGAGNVDGETPVFCDVRHKVYKDDLVLDSWTPGSLRGNRPAHKNTILRALREEILPAVAQGGTVYLFVGDHGERPRGDDQESRINLWSLERDSTSERGWRTINNATLGVGELRRVFMEGLGKGRVLFCMTQCHAGGFHYLAIPHEMTPNPNWFGKLPAWAAPKSQRAFPRVAGFAATDEYSPAAGCDPAPTMAGWAGYERFVPESLFGIDLFTLNQTGPQLRSFAEAHEAATVTDKTIDNPYATSDQYLERWADLIEEHLVGEGNLTARLKRQIGTYHKSVNGSAPRLRDPAFRARQALFNRFTMSLVEQNPEVKDLLLTGTRRQLEKAMEGDEPRSEEREGEGRRRRGGGRGETRALWNDTLRPAWAAAVEADRLTELLGAALDFEKHLLRAEADGADFFSGRRTSLAEEVFWHSGYGEPKSLDPIKAEAVAQWGALRRARILEWAQESEDEAVRSAGERLAQRNSGRSPPPVEPDPNVFDPIRKDTAAERVLFYRRVLAAWQFLIDLRERPALDRLRELIELEQTPFPK